MLVDPLAFTNKLLGVTGMKLPLMTEPNTPFWDVVAFTY